MSYKEYVITKVRSLLEGKIKKLVPVRKMVSKGPVRHSIKYIYFKATKRGLKPGRYFVDGVRLVVEEDGMVKLECPSCGAMLKDPSDYTSHQEKYHNE